jgi:DNA-binding NarL/FixJ family response regulator
VSNDRVRVLLADDHILVADGIAALLCEEYELAGRASNGRELVDAARRLKPDVVVTDISMPVLNGIDALRELKRAGSGIRVVVVTMHADPFLAAEAVRAGAMGYVLKHSAGGELLQAVREVVAGRVYITPLIAGELLARLAAVDGGGADPRLTARQRQVLQLVAEGHTMKQVAVILRVSRRTAEAHKYQIMAQLDVHSTAQLVQHAIRMGLVSVDPPVLSPH